MTSVHRLPPWPNAVTGAGDRATGRPGPTFVRIAQKVGKRSGSHVGERLRRASSEASTWARSMDCAVPAMCFCKATVYVLCMAVILLVRAPDPRRTCPIVSGSTSCGFLFLPSVGMLDSEVRISIDYCSSSATVPSKSRASVRLACWQPAETQSSSHMAYGLLRHLCGGGVRTPWQGKWRPVGLKSSRD